MLWLGNYIIAERPDTVLCLGDYGEMGSLSSYDKGKRGFEGRRYKKDCEAVQDGDEKLWRNVNLIRAHAAKNHRSRYRPRTIMLQGNHEERVDRLTQCHPELHGQVDWVTDLGLNKNWEEIYAYQEVVNVQGFAVSHNFPSGVMGRPIGGENQAAGMANKLRQSAIAGHSHTRDLAERTRPDRSGVVCIVAGCYTHPTHVEGWEKAVEHLWWRGVVLLDGAEQGRAEKISFIDQRFLEKRFG
jgi:hypothetical protein